MIKVRIRVSSETRDFAVVVCAENLQRAAQSVSECYPDSAVEIAFPIEPEQFFARDPTTANNRPRGRGEEVGQPRKVS
jgi:hypothetical protein